MSDTIDHAFRHNSFESDKDFAYRKFIGSDKRGQDVECVGFKWRPHGSWQKIKSVFTRNDTNVFVLFRKDFVELVCSLEISRHQQLEGAKFHAQFKFSNMSDDEKRAFQEKLDRPISVSAGALTAVAWKRALHAVRLRLLALLCARRARSQMVMYEDFLLNPKAFYRAMLESMELSDDCVDEMLNQVKLQKVAQRPAKERVKNTWAFKLNPVFWLAHALYAMATFAPQEPLPIQEVSSAET